MRFLISTDMLCLAPLTFYGCFWTELKMLVFKFSEKCLETLFAFSLAFWAYLDVGFLVLSLMVLLALVAVFILIRTISHVYAHLVSFHDLLAFQALVYDLWALVKVPRRLINICDNGTTLQWALNLLFHTFFRMVTGELFIGHISLAQARYLHFIQLAS